MTDQAELRKRWYEAHARRFLVDTAAADDFAKWRSDLETSTPEALAILDALDEHRDLERFRAALQDWAVKPTTHGFNGFSGQMFVNQLATAEGDHAGLVRILVDATRPPADDASAREKLEALTRYTEQVRVGAHPSPGRVPYVLTYLWALRGLDTWPVMRPSSQAFIESSLGVSLPADPVERYMTFLRVARELDSDAWRFGMVTRWWELRTPEFLDDVLCDRCALEPSDEQNAAALVGVGRYLGRVLSDEVSKALDRTVTAKRPNLRWTPDRFRSDTYADWWIQDKGGLGLRLWINPSGAAIGIRVGSMGDGWFETAKRIIEAASVSGYELIAGRQSRVGRDVGFIGGVNGEFMYGRWFARDMLNTLDLPTEVLRIGADLRPVVDQLDAAAKGTSIDASPGAEDPLATVVATFRRETGYPSLSDQRELVVREEFARLIQPEVLSVIDPSDIRRIYSSQRYGFTGPMAGLNAFLRDATSAEYDRLLESLHFLLWGDGEDAARIDELLEGERRIPGLGESVMVKLLALAHPDEWVPIFPAKGAMGKIHMLELLDLEEPHGTRGEVQVASNRAIYRRLNRYFPADPWGMNRFCYWLNARVDEAPQDETDAATDPLEELADELLVDPAFLREIVELLDDKGQVILYGPPGTGKTYLARKLAEILAPDIQRRRIVQFHPSTSYEDFFEGFRPQPDAAGGISYALTPGPLAQMAEQARTAPGTRHIMIIDEINRANLPKVFGELLFLLEYRDEPVTTLYRADEPFELPKEIQFIGTMNTADRSIALVDAALRRRFHFVPIFPHDGAMAGLLDRWLERHQPGAAWVGELVEMVNGELSQLLGGPHLQIGPSHFMHRDLSEASVERLWRYNVEPFIEDQLFGNEAQIDRFRFAVAYARYSEQSGRDGSEADQPDEPRVAD